MLENEGGRFFVKKLRKKLSNRYSSSHFEFLRTSAKKRGRTKPESLKRKLAFFSAFGALCLTDKLAEFICPQNDAEFS